VDYSLSQTGAEKELTDHQGNHAEMLGADSTDTLDAAKTSLQAHQTLVDINPENLEKFRSVLELLKDDVNNLEK
jgi:hypothetical protein